MPKVKVSGNKKAYVVIELTRQEAVNLRSMLDSIPEHYFHGTRGKNGLGLPKSKSNRDDLVADLRWLP